MFTDAQTATSPYARRFAETIQRLAPRGVPETALAAVRFAAALVAQKTVVDKNVCADISAHPGLAEILASADCAFAVSMANADDYRPLVLEDTRLYLRLYWSLENRLAEMLKSRGNIFVVTGGPGTGKTTGIKKIVGEYVAESERGLSVKLCAPTGKAATRMEEALPDFRAETLHRLLGYQPWDGAFKRNAESPIDADILVVDEASMIDLPMMTALFGAVPESCRVFLLGDKDQLAAVETGCVFADICDAWEGRGNLTRLTINHRSKEAPEVVALKDLVNAGKADEAWDYLVSQQDGSSLALLSPTDKFVFEQGRKETADPEQNQNFHAFHFSLLKNNLSPAEALDEFNRFRILCATRDDTEEANDAVMRLLGVRMHGHGCPVMITENDYATGLFNGDTGLCLNTPTDGMKVWFPPADASGAARPFAVSQLPAHEPCFAMTVHKSQGSGFDEVLLVLPDTPLPLLTRELLYTGITRARKRCVISASEAVFKTAVARRAHRASGLTAKLKKV